MVKYAPIVDYKKDIPCLQNRTKRKRAIANHHLSAYYGLNIIKLWYIYYFPTSLLVLSLGWKLREAKKLAQVTYSAIVEPSDPKPSSVHYAVYHPLRKS